MRQGSVLVTQEEPTIEEQATDRALQTGLAVAENMRWEYVWGATLILGKFPAGSSDFWTRVWRDL